MSPEKQRIAIAKACGWKDCNINWLQKPALLLGSKPTFSNGKIISYLVDQTIPHYPSDLNACHEMEKVLTHEQHIDYMEWLGLCDDDYGHKVWAYVHATATQRCAAFLRTLGLWEERINTAKSASSTSPVPQTNPALFSSKAEAQVVELSEQMIALAQGHEVRKAEARVAELREQMSALAQAHEIWLRDAEMKEERR